MPIMVVFSTVISIKAVKTSMIWGAFLITMTKMPSTRFEERYTNFRKEDMTCSSFSTTYIEYQTL